MKRSPEEVRAWLEARAGEMRRSPTLAEAHLRAALKPLGFHFQWIIVGMTKNAGEWRYILDFYQPVALLCIEVDGGIHKRQKGRDRRRDTRLKTAGVRTVRLTNKYVLSSTLTELRARVEKEMGDGDSV